MKKILFLSFLSLILLGCQSQKTFKVFIPQNYKNEYYQYIEQFCDEDSFLIIKNNKENINKLIHLIKMIDYFISISEENLTYNNTVGEGSVDELYKTQRVHISEDGEIYIEEYDEFRYIISSDRRFSIEGGFWDGFIPVVAVTEQYETQLLKYYKQIANLLARTLNSIDSSYVMPEY